MLFDDPQAPPWPDWYRPTKKRPDANRRVRMGLHPFGLELGPEGTTCGKCAHVRYYLGCYPKCAPKGKPEPAHVAETDLNTRWRACAAFQPKASR